MAKFYGGIGYSDGGSVETAPGVWKDLIVERKYYGEVLRNARKLDSGEKVNNDISVNNSISIVADAYLSRNYVNIRYIEWLGTYWLLSEVTVEAPRLILRLGGKYNGPTA